MYAIHTTPGFIIDSKPYGEAGKILWIFTRDLGLVAVTAQGIRLEKSKLRYHVQDYSSGVFSLVRGKEFWRLTSASDNGGSKELPDNSMATFLSRTLAARVAVLLKRFLQGEDAHLELFNHVNESALFLQANPDLSEERIKSLESLTVLRMLNSMGYIGNEPIFSEVLSSDELEVSILDEIIPARSVMIKHINTALKESHL